EAQMLAKFSPLVRHQGQLRAELISTLTARTGGAEQWSELGHLAAGLRALVSGPRAARLGDVARKRLKCVHVAVEVRGTERGHSGAHQPHQMAQMASTV